MWSEEVIRGITLYPSFRNEAQSRENLPSAGTVAVFLVNTSHPRFVSRATFFIFEFLEGLNAVVLFTEAGSDAELRFSSRRSWKILLLGFFPEFWGFSCPVKGHD